MSSSNIVIGWDDATCEVRSDIVFENRYKDYGAYVIRKNYSRSVIMALIISVSFLGLCLSIPYITRWIHNKQELNKAKQNRDIVVTLTDVKPLETKPEEIKPVEIVPPKIETVRFTEFVVKKDEEVPDDQVVHTQDELADKNISTKDQEGKKDIILPTEDEGNAVIDEPKEEQIYTFVEQQPQFPGGDEAMYKYISSKIHYPVEASENNISGKVILQFVVEKNGKVTDIKVLREPGGGCGAEAIRVVSNMPAWKPGKQNGQAVRVRYTVPINFTLSQTQ